MSNLQPKELVFCNGSQRLATTVSDSGMVDYNGCALWELTDGMGRFWLCPYYMIKRLPKRQTVPCTVAAI